MFFGGGAKVAENFYFFVDLLTKLKSWFW